MVDDDDDYDGPDSGSDDDLENEEKSQAAVPLATQSSKDAPVADTPGEGRGADVAGGAADKEGDEDVADDADFDDAFDEVFEEDDGLEAAEPAAEGAVAPEQEEGSQADPVEATEAMDVSAAGQAATAEQEEVLRKKRIMDSLTEQQLDRYESFRRSSLARPKVKKYVSSLLGYAVNDKAIIALCGMGKVFVGELIETARVLAAEEGHHGPLLPRHVHWAYQNLNHDHKIPRRQPAKRLLK